jgi:hypothetical protein
VFFQLQLQYALAHWQEAEGFGLKYLQLLALLLSSFSQALF